MGPVGPEASVHSLLWSLFSGTFPGSSCRLPSLGAASLVFSSMAIMSGGVTSEPWGAWAGEGGWGPSVSGVWFGVDATTGSETAKGGSLMLFWDVLGEKACTTFSARAAVACFLLST